MRRQTALLLYVSRRGAFLAHLHPVLFESSSQVDVHVWCRSFLRSTDAPRDADIMGLGIYIMRVVRSVLVCWILLVGYIAASTATILESGFVLYSGVSIFSHSAFGFSISRPACTTDDDV